MSITLRDQNTSSKSHHVVLPETNTLRENEPKHHIPVLDGLRALACLGVLSSHLNSIAAETGIWGPTHDIHGIAGILTYFFQSLGSGGTTGVHLFFVLSGFLLFLPYAKALLFESPWPSLHRFYLRRFFRILPGYYVTVFLIALFLHPVFLDISHWHDLWLFLTFNTNSPLTGELNGVFWTLAIEFQFYLLLPIIAWLFSLIVSRGTLHWRLLKLTFCLLLMIAWGLLTRYWGIYLFYTTKLDFLIPHPISLALKPFIYGDQSKYVEVFAIGMLVCTLYTYMQYIPSAQHWNTRMRRLSPLLLTIGLAVIYFLFFWAYYFFDINVHNFTLFARYVKYPPYYIIFTFLDPHIPTIIARYLAEWENFGYGIGYGLCMLAMLYGPGWTKRLLESTILRWISSISFSLYMWHQQLIYLFRDVFLFKIQQQHLGHLIEFAALWCWTLVIILPISAMFYAWIEKPGIQLGERFIYKLGI